MKNYRQARKRVSVSVGESVRIIRELQGLSQNELAEHTGISQATISAIENDRERLGGERPKSVGSRKRAPDGRRRRVAGARLRRASWPCTVEWGGTAGERIHRSRCVSDRR